MDRPRPLNTLTPWARWSENVATTAYHVRVYLQPSKVVARIYLPLGMAVLIVGCYVSSLNNPFLMDDHTAIVNNPDVLQPGGWRRAWVQDFWAGSRFWDAPYRPMAVLSFHLNTRVAGLSPPAFRLFNMMLLGLLGWLLAAWLSRYTDYKTVAWLAAFLFVAHPTHAQAINHIVGRADLLAMIGVVGFLLIHRRLLEGAQRPLQNEPPDARAWDNPASTTLAALACAFVAFFSAEAGILLIPMVATQTLVWRSKEDRRAGPVTAQTRRVHAWAGACIALPLAAWVWGWWLMTHAAPARATIGRSIQRPLEDITVSPLLAASLTDKVTASFSRVWFYARQVVWPQLGFDQTPHPMPSWGSNSTWLGLAVFAVMVIALAMTFRRRHWMTMALVLAIGQAVLVTGLLVPLPVYASNQLTVPFNLAAAMWLMSAISRTTGHSLRKRAFAVIPCALAVGPMVIAVTAVNARWFSTPRLMAYDLSQGPRQPARMYRYADALVRAGVYESAIDWLDRTIELRPHSIQARQKLALAYRMQGDFSAEAHQLQEILDLVPDHLPAHTRLARLAMDDRDLDRAQYHLTAAKRIAPNHADVMYADARLAHLEGNLKRARQCYELLLKRHPWHEQGRRDYEVVRQSEDTEGG